MISEQSFTLCLMDSDGEMNCILGQASGQMYVFGKQWEAREKAKEFIERDPHIRLGIVEITIVVGEPSFF